MASSDPDARAELVEVFTSLSVTAALAILDTGHRQGLQVKGDGSPVTRADQCAEMLIRDGLAQQAPGFPVISEEEAHSHRPSAAGRTVILVDPLDGTRDFVAGRDEYTVNIALLADGVPVAGVIAAPALGTVWRGATGRGAERLRFASDGKTASPQPIHTRPRPPRDLVVLVSRSHLEPRTQAYLDRLPGTKVVPCGSALKFCWIAEGAADHYPRLAPTHDWDVAAGHAIIVAAGGKVVAPDGGKVLYGSAELLIPAFLAWGDARSAAGITG